MNYDYRMPMFTKNMEGMRSLREVAECVKVLELL